MRSFFFLFSLSSPRSRSWYKNVKFATISRRMHTLLFYFRVTLEYIFFLFRSISCIFIQGYLLGVRIPAVDAEKRAAEMMHLWSAARTCAFMNDEFRCWMFIVKWQIFHAQLCAQFHFWILILESLNLSQQQRACWSWTCDFINKQTDFKFVAYERKFHRLQRETISACLLQFLTSNLHSDNLDDSSAASTVREYPLNL